MWRVFTTFCYAWKLKWPLPIPNPSTHFQFPILIFVWFLWRLILYLCLWICAKLWQWSFQLWIMARLGLKKVVDWILVQSCKVKLKISLLITPCNLLFHFSILKVFLPMQVFFVPSLLLFYKFFLFFFCKEGLKEIQPPSKCFQPLWTWLCLNFQGFVCI
jgi:hypothetical protein